MIRRIRRFQANAVSGTPLQASTLLSAATILDAAGVL